MALSTRPSCMPRGVLPNAVDQGIYRLREQQRPVVGADASKRLVETGRTRHVRVHVDPFRVIVDNAVAENADVEVARWAHEFIAAFPEADH